MKKSLLASAILSSVLITPSVFAEEHPIGEAKMNGMEIDAVYLQPIDMEPRGMGLSSKEADVHLEVDIHALKGNLNGFGEGEWIPYLTVGYTLINTDTNQKQVGDFIPMVAKDGPHYGINAKMFGVGNYILTLHIDPPPKAGFHRHTDQETGVARWWKPFDVSYKFKYDGLKK